MKMKPTIDLYLEYCMSKQLRPKSMHAYEQGLKLFAVWLEEELEITEVEDIRDAAIRKYILDLQVRGKYTVSSNKRAEKINYPHHRTDYGQKISNTTINNYEHCKESNKNNNPLNMISGLYYFCFMIRITVATEIVEF